MIDYNTQLCRKIEHEKSKRRIIEEKGLREKEPNLISISRALDEYYFFNKLQLYCAYLSFTKIINPDSLSYHQQEFKLVEEIDSWVKNSKNLSPLVKIYNDIRILYENIETDLIDLKSLFDSILNFTKSQINNFTKEESLELYSLLTNFCIKKINSGDHEFYKKFFLINNEMIHFRFWKKNKSKTIIPPTEFRNLVTAAIIIKDESFFQSIKTLNLTPNDIKLGFRDEFEWVDKFMNQYKSNLEGKTKSKTYRYCKTYVEFNRKDFIKAYKILKNPLHVRGVLSNMNIKVLYLRLLYEIYTKHSEILDKDKIDIEKVLESYRGLIRDDVNRKKRINYQIAFYKDFHFHFKKLYQFYIKYGRLYKKGNQDFIEEKKKLEKKFNTITYPYQDWFSEKLNEIK